MSELFFPLNVKTFRRTIIGTRFRVNGAFVYSRVGARRGPVERKGAVVAAACRRKLLLHGASKYLQVPKRVYTRGGVSETR